MSKTPKSLSTWRKAFQNMKNKSVVFPKNHWQIPKFERVGFVTKPPGFRDLKGEKISLHAMPPLTPCVDLYHPLESAVQMVEIPSTWKPSPETSLWFQTGTIRCKNPLQVATVICQSLWNFLPAFYQEQCGMRFLRRLLQQCTESKNLTC